MTSATTSSGIIDKPSNHSVDETVARLKNILQSKGVNLFAVIDHSGEAGKVGLKMPNTKLLIFGNPKAGTPLMLAAPSMAIDLPLKILIWEDANAKVWVSYNSPAYLQERHHLPPDLLQNIAVVETLATGIWISSALAAGFFGSRASEPDTLVNSPYQVVKPRCETLNSTRVCSGSTS